MENDNTQKELFEFEPPKRQKPRFSFFSRKHDSAVALTAEKMVFAAIGIIMLLVVSFALGVERGKSLSSREVLTQPPSEQAILKPTPATNIAPKEKVTPAPAKPVADMPYTIVAAAFTKEDYASKEAGRLKGMGLEAFVIKSDPYYLACVGSFATKDSAQKILGKVKKMHNDAYIRMR